MKRNFTPITRFLAALALLELALLCMVGTLQVENIFPILLLLSMLVLMGFFRWIRPDLGRFIRRLQPLNASDGAWPKPIQRLLPFCCAVLPICAALVLPMSSAQAQGCLRLDSWLVAQSLGGVGGPTSSVVSGAGILGGERDMVLSNMTPADGNGIRAESVPTFFAGFPVLEMENASGRFSTLTVTWDGSDGDASALNTSGLNGVNLTANGATGFFSTINLDGMPGTGDLSVTIQIYDMVGGVSSVTINVPPANSTTVPFNAPFSAFSAGANFAQVGAIVLTVNMQNRNGWDVYLTEIKLDCCPAPTGITFTQSPATCTGTTANNNGTITLVTASNGTHYGVSTLGAATYDGPAFAGAAAISLPQIVRSSIPNTGGTYIVRIFNGADDCYTDQAVAAPNISCTCPVLPCAGTTVTKN